MLHSICQQIWKTQQRPQDWKRSVFISILKKGNAKECSNYRTIALIFNSVQSLSCVGLFVTPWTAAYQAPLSLGFSRQEYWSGLPLPLPVCRWVQLCGSLNILWHCLSLGLEWKLTFSSPVATAEWSKCAGILSAALSQYYVLGFEVAQLEFYHLH